jgi:hypothetical protein
MMQETGEHVWVVHKGLCLVDRTLDFINHGIKIKHM